MTTTATLVYTVARYFDTGASLDAQIAAVPIPPYVYTLYGLRFVSDATVSGVRTIVLGTGPISAAAAAAKLGGGSEGSGVAAVNLGVGTDGIGYTVPPLVTLTPAAGDGGSGAQASAVMGVARIDVLAGGSGYVAPVVTLSGGLAPNGAPVAATASATVVGGAITAITVITNGAGYTTLPEITITDSAGSGATALAQLGLVSITVTAPGRGYASPPTVVITPLFQKLFPTAALQQFALSQLMTSAIQRLALVQVTATAPVIA